MHSQDANNHDRIDPNILPVRFYPHTLSRSFPSAGLSQSHMVSSEVESQSPIEFAAIHRGHKQYFHRFLGTFNLRTRCQGKLLLGGLCVFSYHVVCKYLSWCEDQICNGSRWWLISWSVWLSGRRGWRYHWDSRLPFALSHGERRINFQEDFARCWAGNFSFQCEILLSIAHPLT